MQEHYEELLSGRVADAGQTDSEFLQLHAEMQAGEAAPHEVVQQLRERLHSGELQHGQVRAGTSRHLMVRDALLRPDSGVHWQCVLCICRTAGLRCCACLSVC